MLLLNCHYNSVPATAGYPVLCYVYMFEQKGWSRCSLSDVVVQLKSLQPAKTKCCLFVKLLFFRVDSGELVVDNALQ